MPPIDAYDGPLGLVVDVAGDDVATLDAGAEHPVEGAPAGPGHEGTE